MIQDLRGYDHQRPGCTHDTVRDLATIGLLEGIQNTWANDDQNPEVFVEFILPESRKWWGELNDFWAGKIPYVGAGILK